MPVRILRRPRAVSDAESLADWIAKDSLAASLRFLENVEDTLARLADFPSSGSPYRIDVPRLANLRFVRVVGFPNHIVFYVEHSTAIEVVRILHGARDIDAELRGT
jgi:toxin ParE1/3/4